MANREVFVDDKSFEDIQGAASYLSRRLSNHWLVAALIGKTLKAELVDEDENGDELIVLSSDGEEVNRFPRNTASNHTGVGLRTGSMNLIAHIGPYHSSTFLDRGLLWVPSKGDIESALLVEVRREHGLDEEGIAVQLDEAFEKGDAFVQGLLEGNPNPPYSRDYSEASAA